MNEQAVAVVKQDNFLTPAASLDRALERYTAVNSFIDKILKPDIDYGKVPGSDKDTLLKPGAEKLCSFFGLSPRFEAVTVIEDWIGKDYNSEPFFYYRYKCSLYSGDRLIAEGEGSCNSRESKYRYRWVPRDQVPEILNIDSLKTKPGSDFQFDFAIEKAETAGKYGKPQEYWDEFKKAIKDGRARQVKRKFKSGKEGLGYEIDSTVYRVPNSDVADLVNTLQKMAQKRALVAPVLIATNTSERFTQDVEDLDQGLTGSVSEKVAHAEPAEYTEVSEQTKKKPASTKGAAKKSAVKAEDEIDLTPHAGKPTKQHIDYFMAKVHLGLLSDDEMFGSPDKPGWLDKMGEKFTDAYFVPCIKELLKRKEGRVLSPEQLNSIDQVHKAWLAEIGGK